MCTDRQCDNETDADGYNYAVIFYNVHCVASEAWFTLTDIISF